MSDMTLAGIIIGALWTFSLIYADYKGFCRGWKAGNKKAFEVIKEKLKRHVE